MEMEKEKRKLRSVCWEHFWTRALKLRSFQVVLQCNSWCSWLSQRTHQAEHWRLWNFTASCRTWSLDWTQGEGNERSAAIPGFAWPKSARATWRSLKHRWESGEPVLNGCMVENCHWMVITNWNLEKMKWNSSEIDGGSWSNWRKKIAS